MEFLDGVTLKHRIAGQARWKQTFFSLSPSRLPTRWTPRTRRHRPPRHQARQHLCHEARPRQDSGFWTGKGDAQSSICGRNGDHDRQGYEPEHLTSPGRRSALSLTCLQSRSGAKTWTPERDLFSFGVVLYEMATGSLPFRGDTSGTIFDAILNRAPTSPVRLNPDVSDGLERMINKALEKDRDIRYQHASELRADLKRLRRDTESGGKAAVVADTRPQRRRSPLLWAALAVVVAGLAGGAAVMLRRSNQPAAPNSSQWVQLTNFTDSTTKPALSSDGRMLAFLRGSASLGASEQFYVKLLPDGEPVQLTHDDTLKMPAAFSPDGSRLAYGTTGADWQTWVVPVLGGQPQLLLSNASGLTWIDAHHVMFSEIKSGSHLAVVTATESRSEQRDVYVPPRNTAAGRDQAGYRAPSQCSSGSGTAPSASHGREAAA